MVLLDLFSGAGGFASGLMQAGFRFNRHYFSEIDEHAIACYRYHFRNAKNCGDVTKIRAATLEPPDIVCFGFPCQDLSIAGEGKGIAGKRSGLFFEAIRLIRCLRPKVFVFENVKGLLTAHQGKDFEIVLREIAGIGGYQCQWELINTLRFLPQHRERVYFVGIAGKEGITEIFPVSPCNRMVKAQAGKRSKRGQEGLYTPALTTKCGEIAFHTPYVLHNGKYRFLTPLECERLQGFPDNWTKQGMYPDGIGKIPDRQRYRLMGNAVSVPVVISIARKLHAGVFKGKGLSGTPLIKNDFMWTTIAAKPLSIEKASFVREVKKELVNGQSDARNKSGLEKLAATEYGITDKTEVKELTELAIVQAARYYAHTAGTVRERFDKIVDLYQRQVNLSHRTSQSILLQQYSTPAPIGYLMGVFCGLDQLQATGGLAFEPSAGNGLLTIAAAPRNVYVNEIDAVRRRNLETQGFANVWRRDGASPFSDLANTFTAVLTNPPFGTLDNPVMFEDYKISSLEHLMGLYALETMVYNGKAAIIIGGHTDWDNKGRIQAGKNRIFFNFLYSRYYVKDVINVDGRRLYSRQGTAFDVRLILIDGRKPRPEGVAPLFQPMWDTVVRSFDDLFERVMAAMGKSMHTIPEHPINLPQTDNDMDELERQAKQIIQKLRNNSSFSLSGPEQHPLDEKNEKLLDELHASYYRLKRDNPDKVYLFEFGPGYYLGFEMDARIMARVLSSDSGTRFRFNQKHNKLIPRDEITYSILHAENGGVYMRKLSDAKIDFQIIETKMPMDWVKVKNKIKEHQEYLLSQFSIKPKKPPTLKKLMWENEHLHRILKKADAGAIYFFQIPGDLVTFKEDAVTISEYLNLPLYKYRDIHQIKTFRASQYREQHLFHRLRKAGFKIKFAFWNLVDDQPVSGFEVGTLGAPYLPASQACVVLNTQVPDSMAFETQSAVDRIRREVGGDMDNFVRDRLGYATKVELCRALSAEQIDAVGVAIYNIEARSQGMIIGDQTGIGKGRVAASIIRYATQQDLTPIFLTEKANLFSDIYRDLAAIGSGHLRPFIVNARESKSDIKDEDGNVVYQAPEPEQQRSIITGDELPAIYDFIVATYSQFNSYEKKPEKPNFLRRLAEGNIMIMDEAHNSSGASNTGTFMQGIVSNTRGVIFLSATFAKRADNMPIYAMKTSIADCTMSKENLVEAITRGGVALQEVLSAQLVSEGQMLRRERSFEGVEVNYLTLTDIAEEHRAIADNITEILRDIIAFQKIYVDKLVEELDDIAAAEGKEMSLREGTSQAGVDNLPYFSKVFQVINQMLFSLKADAVADRAIMRLKEGKKPVIAFASTMGSFIETLETDTGMPVADGDTINADFSEVLWRGLDGVLRYTEKDVNGKPIYKKFAVEDLGEAAVIEHKRISDRIREVSTGITISPIDVIIQKLSAEGYSVAEVTGRKYELQLNRQTSMGLVLSRRRLNVNDAFRRFNNNEVDVLMINQSGSTGASAHAIPTARVPAAEVRQRVMIVLQAELDISTEVQKRGRINRTGQILKPIYDYLISAIPAEQRLMMMLQKKLKSLDANTTSNQKQSTKILDVPDFLNKYGDKIVKEYLIENPEVNNLLDDPLRIKSSGEDNEGSDPSHSEDAAMRVSGRVAVLSTKMQAEFYNEVAQRYSDYVEYLKQVGEYDLEVEAMALQAETTSARVVKVGNGAGSVFGTDSILETVKANVLKKPFTRTELDNLLTDAIKDETPQAIQQTLITTYEQDWLQRLDKELDEVSAYYAGLIQDVPNEKKILKLKEGSSEWHEAVAEREKELQEAQEKKLQHVQTTADNRKFYLLRLFRFYYISRVLDYPIESFAGGKEMVPAVFLGVVIDYKKKNPFIPSQVKLRFAIAGSMKYLVLPASMSAELLGIMGASSDTKQASDRKTLLNGWASFVQKSSVDRKTRHIITGNLLQAFSDFRGKLVSYTTLDGEVKKGILMPEHWNPGEEVADNVTVPIIKALPLVRSIVNGGQMKTDNGISFFKKGSKFRVIVSGSRQRGGDIFLDRDLLALVDGNNFEKVSANMSAWLDETRINEFVHILGQKHGVSVNINGAQFRQIETQVVSTAQRRAIVLPAPVDERAEQQAVTQQQAANSPVEEPDIDILELEAEALIIKLKLLAHKRMAA